MSQGPETRAEVVLPTRDLRGDLPFFQALGMRLDMIGPADDPSVAVLSGHGLRLRLQRGDGPPGTICLLREAPGEATTSPGGTRVEVASLDPPVLRPPTEHAFAVRRLRDGAPWVIGRAGMHYRDLVPSRLGGAVIASHIRIPDGGPVPDVVHFHEVGFQLIFCVAGWVDVVYEDQGGPMRSTAGDCFIQPPRIRHRVLHASEGIEVIEVGVPAEHATRIDHDMALPTPHLRPDREWDGQRFVFDRAEGATWRPFRLPGFQARDTGIADATGGVAGVEVARRGAGAPAWAAHDADILFAFVLRGSLTLEGEGQAPHDLQAGDAFVVPPGLPTRWGSPSADVEVLEVALPGRFKTKGALGPP